MKELIEFIVKKLADEPDAVEVNMTESEDRHSHYKLHVSSADCGKVIGRKGRTIHAIRMLLSAASGDDHKATLEVVEP